MASYKRCTSADWLRGIEEEASNGGSYASLGRKLGYSANYARAWVKVCAPEYAPKFQANKEKRLNHARAAQVAAWEREGLTGVAMAAQLGITKGALCNWRSRNARILQQAREKIK